MLNALRALLSHWRRHPLGLLTLLVGLAAATALGSGVRALNAEARASYARAAALVGGEDIARITAADGGRFPLADFLALRRAGWKVSPMLEGDLRRPEGTVRLLGIEPLTLPPAATTLDRVLSAGSGPESGSAAERLTAFIRPPHLALAAPETAAWLAGVEGLPPVEAAPGLPPDTLVTDIGAAEALLGPGATGRVSRLVLDAAEAPAALPPELAGRLVLSRPVPGGASDLDRLTASFHLNLTAFGFLSFVVGLFIVHAATGLAFEQRRPILRTLRACGVSLRQLTAALLAETLLVAAVAGLIGTALGYLTAAALLPDVAASLRGLYGASVPGQLTLGPTWWLSGLGVSLAGALAGTGTSLLRAARLPVLAPAAPQAWLEAEGRGQRRQRRLALAIGATGLLALGLGHGLAAGFAVMGALLTGAALLLPSLLAAGLRLGQRRARDPALAWAWADARMQLPGLSLALMALLLALATNIGVGTMVESFRATFLTYLDRRLASELYVTLPDASRAAEITAWLEHRPDVAAVLPIVRAATRTADGWPVEVYGYRDHATYRENWPLITTLPGAWDAAARGDGVLVSEQFARRLGLAPGDALTLPTPGGPFATRVLGVYADYGNPEGQVMLPLAALAAHWPAAETRSLALRADPGAVPALAADIRAAFALPGDAVIDQRALKATSRQVFEETFAITVALNALTLGVAGVALFTSQLALAEARLAQVAPVWALGLTRRRLAVLELGKTLALAALTAAAALPLGLAVAWVLTAIVNVRAFGWRLPVLLLPGQWAMLLALALGTAALAAAWPAWALRRASPATLLRRFSNER